ncbi:vacuolar protein-sorting-associated protein 25 isoform X2 [Myotis lucifugus]|uniref:vacuolar protein-sorting-associated protein 25 isoform X2 n=1 Tax=Myotis lucifugus TaxID=59463 RepID=UPI000CCC4F49|nr:vacuolar protein-sorting-associated protein 25 isoform X2 [Myotis lucifugus]
MAMSFEWPWQYRFPPFFTLQPNVDTRQKQLAAWCSLVLSFCRLHKQASMTVMEAQESPLFNNVKLQRKLPMESIQVVLEELRKKAQSSRFSRQPDYLGPSPIGIQIKISSSGRNRFGSVDRASACGLKGPGFDSGQGHVPGLRAHPQ